MELNDEAKRVLGLEAQKRKNLRDTTLRQRDTARDQLARYQEAYEKAQAEYMQLEEFTPASPEPPNYFQSVKPFWEFDKLYADDSRIRSTGINDAVVRKDESYYGADDNLTGTAGQLSNVHGGLRP